MLDFSAIPILNRINNPFKKAKGSFIAIPLALLLIAYTLYANWYNNRPPQDSNEQKQEKEKREKFSRVEPCILIDPLVEDSHEKFSAAVDSYYKRGYVHDQRWSHQDGTYTICFKFDGTLILDDDYIVDPIEDKPVDGESRLTKYLRKIKPQQGDE